MIIKNDKSKALFIEFGLGVPFNIVLGCVLYFYLLPDYEGLSAASDRLLFAIKCNALPALTMMIALMAVALSRNASSESDPLKMKESRKFQIHARFLVSTHEQLSLFFVSSLALSVFLDENSISLIPTFAILFVINRLLFWAGYLKDPVLRGFGLSGTLYPILFMVLASSYYSVKTML